MGAALELSADIGKKSSCSAFEIPRASFYRFHAPIIPVFYLLLSILGIAVLNLKFN